MKDSTHEIIGIIEATENAELRVRVRVRRSRVVFERTPRELYGKDWLEMFSTEDVAYIGFLNAAINSDGRLPVTSFPRRKACLTEPVVVIAVLFSCALLLSNMTGSRIVEISLPWFSDEAWKIQFQAGTVIFPTTYAFGILLTEVYGYRISRLVIWSGLAANFFVLCGLYGVAHLPDAVALSVRNDGSQKLFLDLVAGYARTLAASTIAYFVGEFTNAFLLAKLKIRSMGGALVKRMCFSVGAAIFLDSLIFCSILFVGVLGVADVISIFVIQILIKGLYEIFMAPIVLKFSKYLKNRDKIDYYDFETNFNPFSF